MLFRVKGHLLNHITLQTNLRIGCGSFYFLSSTAIKKRKVENHCMSSILKDMGTVAGAASISHQNND